MAKYICHWWDLSYGFLVGEAIVVPTAPLPLGLNKCQSNYFEPCSFFFNPKLSVGAGVGENEETPKTCQAVKSSGVKWKTSRGTKYESKKIVVIFIRTMENSCLFIRAEVVAQPLSKYQQSKTFKVVSSIPTGCCAVLFSLFITQT